MVTRLSKIVVYLGVGEVFFPSTYLELGKFVILQIYLQIRKVALYNYSFVLQLLLNKNS